ncbi:CCR4-NOT transcription complex subunit 10-like [Iris pallida]|uniref:CCR4-NOT transcription complex subunit 10-like n=1 Tax=Iris pallida TaxID=29817 RepID=A0AAX6I954_IRIPA|nr:CCR4-NOT transcription complex subunit 10-like [Iris pallida]
MLNQIDNGSNNQHQDSNQGVKHSGISNISAPDDASSDSNATTNITDNSLSETLSDDALEYENLYSTLDGGGGPNFGLLSSNDLVKSVADRTAPVTELKLKMHLYKVRLLLLTRNLKAAKREVKLAMNMARGRDLSTELLLKSQLEYARQSSEGYQNSNDFQQQDRSRNAQYVQQQPWLHPLSAKKSPHIRLIFLQGIKKQLIATVGGAFEAFHFFSG